MQDVPTAVAPLPERPRSAVAARDHVGIEPRDERFAVPVHVLLPAVDEEHRMSRLERREVRDDRLDGIGTLDHHEPSRRPELVATGVDAVVQIAEGQFRTAREERDIVHAAARELQPGEVGTNGHARLPKVWDWGRVSLA